ncbi:regulatory protein RecX [Agromyces sp. C10]|uniref:regulatory protein RecX n=1 Tax=Agromyces sp. C10 TaxID=2935077 RepID=UPI00200AD424|nr:regulatory protein RecX [Agromyces sp. C10]MCK8610382.1 RecX family transcriptional regulator [Agromyces sp. C10]
MGEQRNEGLAPVTYLPWAVPSSGEPDGGRAAPDRAAEAEERVEPAAARMSPRHPAGRGRSGRASNDESRPVERGGGRKARGLAVVGDAAPPETGIERDERIDRLIVSRLRRASLSIAEVRATLAEHGLDDHEIEEWIERYVRLGYLDDRRLAEQLVHSHGVRRGRGSGALLHELGRRGIDGELARSALETLDPDVELEHATLIAERRARQLAGLDPAVAHRRLTAFLLRRGYGSEVVREAVRVALDGDDAG